MNGINAILAALLLAAGPVFAADYPAPSGGTMAKVMAADTPAVRPSDVRDKLSA